MTSPFSTSDEVAKGEVIVRFDGLTSRRTMEVVRGVLEKHSGPVPVRLVVDVPGAEVELGAPHLAVTPSAEFDAELSWALSTRHPEGDAQTNDLPDVDLRPDADADAVRAFYERGPDYGFA